MIESFGQIQDVASDVAHPLKVFEDARREIADANTVEQVNRIVALAIGLAAAARKATDREVEAEAEVLKLEAERRLGQLMQAQKEEVGFNIGTRGSRIRGARVNEKPTLAEAGIDKNTAHRARRAAAMPEAKFNEAAEAKREAVLTRSKKTRIEAAVERKSVPASKQSRLRITHLDVYAAWYEASPEERSKAINSIGLKPLLAALPQDWIPLIEKWLADRRQLSAPAVMPTNSDLGIPPFLRRPLPAKCGVTS
jgi:hypothetical protein